MRTFENAFSNVQVRQLLRLCRRLGNVRDAETRRSQLVMALCRATGAVAGFSAMIDDNLNVSGTVTAVRIGRPADAASAVACEDEPFESDEVTATAAASARSGGPSPADGTASPFLRLAEAEAGELFTFDNPMAEPFLRRFTSRLMEPTAMLRAESVPDPRWYKSDFFDHFRRQSGLDDCIVSAVPLPGNKPFLAAVCLSRALAEQPGESAPSLSRFLDRDREAAELMHAELRWAYMPGDAPHGEEAAPASALGEAVERIDVAPRYRKVLYRLLAGESEKEVAGRLGLSRHTVHHYVRALYAELGVNTRAELMAKFVGA